MASEESNSPHLTVISAAAMVRYLMEVGWEIHVSSDSKIPPRLVKSKSLGPKTTEVAIESLWIDVFLHMIERKIIRERKHFWVNSVRTGVFELVPAVDPVDIVEESA